MPFLDQLVYFCDEICSSQYARHIAVGVLVGLLFGFARPVLSFWAAAILGTGKETIDYFKHTAESSSFNYFTDPKYGIHDGMMDLLFWMIGGYLAYRLLKKSHALLQHKFKKDTAHHQIFVNPANATSVCQTCLLREQQTGALRTGGDGQAT